MDTELSLHEPDLYFLSAPRPQLEHLVQTGVVRLALNGRVHVLDGAGRFDAYAIARQVRRYTSRLDVVLARLRVGRAFTCYQMLALLEAQPGGEAPILALDLLHSFDDPGVRCAERSRLLDGCIAHLQRLSAQAPVLVTSAAGGLHTPLDGFTARLAAAARQVWRFEAPAAPVRQLALF